MVRPLKKHFFYVCLPLGQPFGEFLEVLAERDIEDVGAEGGSATQALNCRKMFPECALFMSQEMDILQFM